MRSAIAELISNVAGLACPTITFHNAERVEVSKVLVIFTWKMGVDDLEFFDGWIGLPGR